MTSSTALAATHRALNTRRAPFEARDIHHRIYFSQKPSCSEWSCPHGPGGDVAARRGVLILFTQPGALSREAHSDLFRSEAGALVVVLLCA